MLGLEAMEESEIKDKKFCECGCGEEILGFIIEKGIIRKDRPTRFKPRHHNRIVGFKKGVNYPWLYKKGMKPEDNSQWKGGRVLLKTGYVKIHKPTHPQANNEGYVLEHRLVYEEYHKCCLLPSTYIHHINGNKRDNRPNNLEHSNMVKHAELHSHTRLRDKKGRWC